MDKWSARNIGRPSQERTALPCRSLRAGAFDLSHSGRGHLQYLERLPQQERQDRTEYRRRQSPPYPFPILRSRPSDFGSNLNGASDEPCVTCSHVRPMIITTLLDRRIMRSNSLRCCISMRQTLPIKQPILGRALPRRPHPTHRPNKQVQANKNTSASPLV